ncbi:Pyruvate/Phosphoenolpyruvate kinase-like domain-containing protein [Plectosphaerella plurivora]|uniref:Pyruvate/Phosphoenolpyruvate kinase-like domain-containing protein n=1 Tax=Plectosphaerella plurivora TaxID=936078 RepID=A0A9P9ABN6_9PEZI|nr:Pyruvate/Phosphoenolpyruvate kinase-like domain-containing protein [Plectosphaerella plurivora]
MSQPATFLRRALLYVPGSPQKMLSKASALKVDTLIYDLEDSVAPELKTDARLLVSKHIASSSSGPSNEVAVRINSVDSGLAFSDLASLVSTAGVGLHTVVVPKVNSEADLRFVADVIRHVSPQQDESPSTTPRQPLQIIALIESALGLSNIHSICKTGRTLGLSGLAFAAEDFAADLSLSRLPDRRELLFARSSLVTAARAQSIPSIVDMVSTGIPTDSQEEGNLANDCVEGRALGFNGKQCIHPSQLGVVQAKFSPTEEELEWAVRVQVGDAQAQAEGKGAWKLDGKMIDVPVVKKALGLLERAAQCGISLDYLKQKHTA